MAAGTAQVTVGNAAYVDLGLGPILLSSPSSLQLIAAASQPAANAVGHVLTESYLQSPNPYALPLITTLHWWALASVPGVVVTVTSSG